VCCPAEVNVPVVGGHAGITILPLFSQVLRPWTMSEVSCKSDTHDPSKNVIS
jgi:malate/lactate dehydrogenase